MPRAEEATRVAAAVARDGRPACIMVPTDLVQYIAQNNDGSFDRQVQRRVEEAAKIQVCSALVTWISFDGGFTKDEVHLQETAKEQPPGPSTGWFSDVGTLPEWVREQKLTYEVEKDKIDKARVHRRDSGLIMIEGRDDFARIYVPLGRRKALFDYHHISLNHLAAEKTL